MLQGDVYATGEVELAPDTGLPRTPSITTDCANGWGDDWWVLTLTQVANVTVTAEDGFAVGDYYEMWVEPLEPVELSNCMIGQTPIPVDNKHSVGSATVSLSPGKYVVSLRDAAFETNPDLCWAGYYVTITLAPFTGNYPWPCELSIEVTVDIKPGSCPNPLNPKSMGSVPVAIVGTEDFDVTTVDPSSLTLAGVPMNGIVEIVDSTEPYESDPNALKCEDCFDADALPPEDCDGDGILDGYCGDGYMDLVVKIDMQELVAAIAATGGVDSNDCIELILAGQTYDGDLIIGKDSVLVRKGIEASPAPGIRNITTTWGNIKSSH